MQETRQAGSRRTTRAVASQGRPVIDKEYEQALKLYQSAVQLMQEGKFDKARAAFEKLLPIAPPELMERTKVYLTACERQTRQNIRTFVTLGEEYDYAISLLNTGDYEDARDHLENILKKDRSADYAHYGLAILNSITGQAEECLEHLATAIQLNAQNRIQARTDSDFQDMADDPRFTELLYPETP
ncbi:MAG TPA: tetratricopeptide repeat protein [Pseudacidobacterium sp.]|nr:tetratricopeptide repeat protein [Pseudacidobacterium sp.]